MLQTIFSGFSSVVSKLNPFIRFIVVNESYLSLHAILHWLDQVKKMVKSPFIYQPIGVSAGGPEVPMANVAKF